MTGADAKAAFDLAAKAVKEGRYAEALAVELLPSDRIVIEQRIQIATRANRANT